MNLFKFSQLENDKFKIQPKVDYVPMKYKHLPPLFHTASKINQINENKAKVTLKSPGNS